MRVWQSHHEESAWLPWLLCFVAPVMICCLQMTWQVTSMPHKHHSIYMLIQSLPWAVKMRMGETRRLQTAVVNACWRFAHCVDRTAMLHQVCVMSGAATVCIQHATAAALIRTLRLTLMRYVSSTRWAAALAARMKASVTVVSSRADATRSQSRPFGSALLSSANTKA